jgi:hypothetical protein
MTPEPRYASVIWSHGTKHAEVWYCPEPELGTPYLVLRDEWYADNTIRAIYEITVAEEVPA